MEEYTNKLPKPWFTPVILEELTDPVGFQDWTKNITYDKYHINLPDGSKTHAKLFMDHQQVFNPGSYTTYLLHRYDTTILSNMTIVVNNVLNTGNGSNNGSGDSVIIIEDVDP